MNQQLPVWKVVLLGVAAYLIFAAPKVGGCNLPIGTPPPFKTDKLGVLIVEETSKRATLPSEQLNILQGTADGSVQKYVKSKNPDGWRLLDPQQDVSMDADWVKAAWQVADKTNLPSIVAASPTRGVKPQRLPATSAETLKLLEPVGGN